MSDLIADDMGEFFGIAGHHTARTLLRVIMDETGMTAQEVTDGYDTPWQGWRDAVTQSWWRLMSRFDPRTWSEAERKALYKDGEDWF